MLKTIVFVLIIIIRSLYLVWVALIETVIDFKYSTFKETYNNFKSYIKDYWRKI